MQTGTNILFQKTIFYISLGGGVLLPNDVSFEVTGSEQIGGLTLNSISGDIKYDTGYQFSGIIGYDINEDFAFETELIYTNFDYDQVDVSASGTITGRCSSSFGVGSFDIDGDISAFSMLFGPKS